MTSDELRAAKEFLERWCWTWVWGFIIWFVVGFVGAVKADNHLPEECPKVDLVGDTCYATDLGKFDWALFTEWVIYGALVALLPAAIAISNHLIFKGREKVGLTPEARREKMRRLEHERNEANRRRVELERRNKQLEQELEIA